MCAGSMLPALQNLGSSNRVMYDFYGAGSKAGDTGGGGSG